MKVESPLCRKVEFSFNQICHPVIVWMTDSEIDGFSNRDLSEFDLFRIKPSPDTLVEFRVNDLTGWNATNEIRHQESPIVLSTSISKKDKNHRVNVPMTTFSSESCISAVIHFKTNHGIQSLELSKCNELKNLLNSSFTFFDDLIPYGIHEDISLKAESIILIEG